MESKKFQNTSKQKLKKARVQGYFESVKSKNLLSLLYIPPQIAVKEVETTRVFM